MFINNGNIINTANKAMPFQNKLIIPKLCVPWGRINSTTKCIAVKDDDLESFCSGSGLNIPLINQHLNTVALYELFFHM